MVLVTVSQNYSNYIIKAILEVAEVRQDHINARLVLFRKKHANIHNQDFAVDFEHGHVSTNFANSTKWNDAHYSRT